MAWIPIGLVLIISAHCQCSVIDLTGTWTVVNNARGYRINGTVPGSMYTALRANNIVPNLLYRDNDVKYRWIGEEDWTYTRTFLLSSQAFQSSSIHLVCDGLDTFSSVYVNDQKVGTSENMFVQYVLDVKSAVKEGENTLRVDFESAVKVAAQKANASAYVIPNNCPPAVQHGECHVNMIRKEQCSFSWDWGPSFPTQGIWKNIYIQAFDSAVIRELSVATSKGSQGKWMINVLAHFDVSGQSVTGSLYTNLLGTTVGTTQTVTLSPTNQVVNYSVSIPSDVTIDPWWPNGYGKQTLYTVNVTFSQGSVVSGLQRSVGFRTVELVQDPVPGGGLTFYFKINQVPVFFKGTNWIPADSFQENITPERLEHLLKSAADVHINSMRVWGGGIYESDELYDLADKYGIMIWQDMMFSVALYPSTSEFLGTVAQEATHQVRRLRHHPSIVLWAGNNENEKGLRQDWFHVAHDYQRYYNDYVKLYVTTLKTVVNMEDSTRVYLTSSPSDGKETEKEGWVAKDPGSELFGDIHFYDYVADLWKDSSFRIPRFSSEYGVQAWCNPDTLEDVFDPADFDYWGDMAYHRNHHGLGNLEMIEEIVLHFNQPVRELPNAQGFKDTKQMFIDLIYLTQINQAVSIQKETEHYRRWQNDVLPDGRGQTMGALYWQLNDIWQAPTWASIDYSGKWKMMHYYARKFFAPVLVSPYVDKNTLNVYIVVDEIPVQEKKIRNSAATFVPITNYRSLLSSEFFHRDAIHLITKTAQAISGTLYIEMYSWDSFTPLKSWNTTYKVSKTSQSVFQQDVNKLLQDSKCPDRSQCFLYIYLDDKASDMATHIPLEYYKNAKGIQHPHVMVMDVAKSSDTDFIITVQSQSIALFVWLDAHGIQGTFSDNGFIMVTPTKKLTFTSLSPVDLPQLKQALQIKSLMDIY